MHASAAALLAALLAVIAASAAVATAHSDHGHHSHSDHSHHNHVHRLLEEELRAVLPAGAELPRTFACGAGDARVQAHHERELARDAAARKHGAPKAGDAGLAEVDAAAPGPVAVAQQYHTVGHPEVVAATEAALRAHGLHQHNDHHDADHASALQESPDDSAELAEIKGLARRHRQLRSEGLLPAASEGADADAGAQGASEGTAASAASAAAAIGRGRSRGLVTQSYASGIGGFMTAAAANAIAVARGMRIVTLWDPIEGSDVPPERSGTGAANGVRQCQEQGSSVYSLLTQGAVLCTSEDVPTEAKVDVLRDRTQFAADFFGSALKVKPAQDAIHIDPSIVDRFRLGQTDVPNADLVVVITARPAAGLNGYALCWQTDQYGRCTVGQFNWVPTVVDATPQTRDAPETVTAQRHTALHELVHVLGGIGPNPVFVTATGTPRPASEVWVSEPDSAHYAKTVTKIITPKVLAAAREHFGCDTLSGVPIEDQPTGKVAHWEARLFGPELMSYGTGTGETIFGDITFAYLEDTNQYVANYSMGGRLLHTGGDTGADLNFKVKVERPADFVPPVSHTPGELRWGRGKGCGFVSDSPAVSEAWSDEYFCTENRNFDCTHDFRMSAVCTVLTGWEVAGIAGSGSPTSFTCGDCPGEGTDTACRPTCTQPVNDNCASAASCGLPSMYQYFTDRSAAEALGRTSATGSRTGGFSSAMDFVPVRLGYWNCQDAEASNGSSLIENQSGGSVSLKNLLGSSTSDMKLFGGQAYCPGCRCFKSSLMDFSSGNINANFPTYGLCYRSNCYREDYLQFAIESQLGTGATWYKCPPAGGKLYIAGFAGAFHCPPATKFCSFETVSGMRYNETNPLWEWVFWSVAGGLPLLTMLVCLIPPLRRRAVGRLKKWCGVNHFNRRGELDLDAEVDDDEEYEPPPKFPGKVLALVNLVVAVSAFVFMWVVIAGAASGRVTVAAAFFIVVCLTVMGFAYMGWRAGTRWSLGTSCVAVSYLFVLFFGLLAFMFSVMYAVAYPEALGRVIERQWPVVAETLPEGVVDEQLVPEGQGAELLSQYAGAAFAFAAVLAGIIVAQLWAAARVVTMPVIASTMYTVISYVVVFAGLCMFGVAGYVSRFSDEGFEGVTSLMALLVVCGLYLVFAGTFAIHASHKKTVKHMVLALGVNAVLLLLVFAAGLAFFSATRDIDATLDKLSDDQIAATSEILGFANGSRDDIAENIKNNLRTMGLFGLVCTLMLVAQLVCCLYFTARVRMHFAHPVTKGMVDGHGHGVEMGRVGAGGGGGRGQGHHHHTHRGQHHHPPAGRV